MKLIAGRRMIESDQVRGLTEAFDRDEKTHMSENPADEINNDPSTKQFPHFVSTFERLNVETLINECDLPII